MAAGTRRALPMALVVVAVVICLRNILGNALQDHASHSFWLKSGNLIPGTDIPKNVQREPISVEKLRETLVKSVTVGRQAMALKDFRTGQLKMDYGMTLLEMLERRGVEVHHTYAKLANWAAACGYFMGHFRGAMEYWETSLKYDPEFADSHYNLASLMSNMSHLTDNATLTIPDLVAAKWHCKKAIKLWESNLKPNGMMTSKTEELRNDLKEAKNLLQTIESRLRAGERTAVMSRIVTVSSRPFGMKVGDTRKVLESSGLAFDLGVRRGDEVYKIDGRKVPFEQFLNLFKSLPLPFDIQILPRNVSENLIYSTPESPAVLKVPGYHFLPQDCLSACRNYTVNHYRDSMYDGPRIRTYLKAINASCPNKTVLDLGCGPGAYFSRQAVTAGAKHVYAIEANERNYLIAKDIIKKVGMEDKITLLQGFSLNVSLPNELEKADIIFHDNFGEIASIDGAVLALGDAFKRLCKPNATCIPQRARTFLAPCELPNPIHWIDAKDMVKRKRKQRVLGILNFPQSHALSPFKPVESLTFRPPLPDHTHEVAEFIVERKGVFQGVATYIELQMHKSLSPVTSLFDITPRRLSGEKMSWWNLFIRFPETEVEEGDIIKLGLHAEYEGLKVAYYISAQVTTKTGRITLGYMEVDF